MNLTKNTRKGPDMIETSFCIEDREMPAHLHGKVMKRVFFAAYGKYLYASATVLVLNLAVLGKEVWRATHEVSLARALQSAEAQFSFISALSWDSIVAITMSALLCAATAVVITKIYRDAKSFGMFRA